MVDTPLCKLRCTVQLSPTLCALMEGVVDVMLLFSKISGRTVEISGLKKDPLYSWRPRKGPGKYKYLKGLRVWLEYIRTQLECFTERLCIGISGEFCGAQLDQRYSEGCKVRHNSESFWACWVLLSVLSVVHLLLILQILTHTNSKYCVPKNVGVVLQVLATFFCLKCEMPYKWPYRITRKITHPLRRFPTPIFSTTRGARTTKRVSLGRSPRDLSIEASLSVCALPIVEKISVENRLRGCVIFRVIRYKA